MYQIIQPLVYALVTVAIWLVVEVLLIRAYYRNYIVYPEELHFCLMLNTIINVIVFDVFGWCIMYYDDEIPLIAALLIPLAACGKVITGQKLLIHSM